MVVDVLFVSAFKLKYFLYTSSMSASGLESGQLSFLRVWHVSLFGEKFQLLIPVNVTRTETEAVVGQTGVAASRVESTVKILLLEEAKRCWNSVDFPFPSCHIGSDKHCL